MEILLNEKKLEGIVSQETTLGTALAAVQSQYIGEDCVIANIYVDGEPLTAEHLSEWKNRPAQDFNEASIQACTRNLLASQGLQLMAQGIAESKTDREQIVELLCQGRTAEAMEKLTGYLQLWDTAQHTLGSASRLLEIDIDAQEIYSGDNSSPSNPATAVTERIDQLTEQLSQIKSALEAGDYVLLGDILDYEFSDLTDFWHDMFIQLADRAAAADQS